MIARNTSATMSFQFDPDSQNKVQDQKPQRVRVGKFSILTLTAFGLLVILLFAWSPVATAARAALARQNAKEALEATAAQDWRRAYQALTLARQRAPKDVEVIMAMVTFLKATGSDPGGLAQQLRLLEQHRPLTEEEELLLGRTLISSGRTKDAREVFEKLPQQHSTRQAGLELLSSILNAEGHHKEAAEISRRAEAQTAESPETHLKAAVTDLGSHFAEVKTQARKQLWQLAENSSTTGLDAIHQLAVDPGLTLPEARHLLNLLEEHPLKTLSARLQLVSALMRLQPDLRSHLADAEVKRFFDTKNGKREEIAYWLMREKLNEQVFALVPRELAVQSRELYPILLQTLAQAERWEELQGLLKLQRAPVSNSLLDLAMAEVQSHLQPDMREARRLLQGTVENAAQAGDATTLNKAAALAERLNLADISCRAYKSAGLLASANKANVEALEHLEKSVELALVAKDTATLLEASRWLHELSPSSAVFADRLSYWRLVLGIEMETVDLAALGQQNELKAAANVPLQRIPTPLLLALSDYRLGDRAAMQQHLAQLTSSTSLAAGPRAVAAGLLSLVGKPDRAFQLAEKIPGALLLDEELTFLKRAL
ncbi:MAG: hypothetical protein B7Z37_04820 [Verrucomicrobia bacterium 12-59-8]|nr:MAG: hypothetical protein B7Z37_04820 [Verrucomicrobia bacterium 12-59-8]